MQQSWSQIISFPQVRDLDVFPSGVSYYNGATFGTLSPGPGRIEWYLVFAGRHLMVIGGLKSAMTFVLMSFCVFLLRIVAGTFSLRLR